MNGWVGSRKAARTDFEPWDAVLFTPSWLPCGHMTTAYRLVGAPASNRTVQEAV